MLAKESTNISTIEQHMLIIEGVPELVVVFEAKNPLKNASKLYLLIKINLGGESP